MRYTLVRSSNPDFAKGNLMLWLLCAGVARTSTFLLNIEADDGFNPSLLSVCACLI